MEIYHNQILFVAWKKKSKIMHLDKQPAECHSNSVHNTISHKISKLNDYYFFILTHSSLVMPNGDTNLGNIGSGYGLLPDGTKPLPEPIIPYHQWSIWYSPEGNYTENTQDINHDNKLKNYTLKITSVSQGNELNKNKLSVH